MAFIVLHTFFELVLADLMDLKNLLIVHSVVGPFIQRSILDRFIIGQFIGADQIPHHSLHLAGRQNVARMLGRTAKYYEDKKRGEDFSHLSSLYALALVR